MYEHEEYQLMQAVAKIDLGIDTDYLRLQNDGLLRAKKGYCWDGPSGPSIDTKTFMRGSLHWVSSGRLWAAHGVEDLALKTENWARMATITLSVSHE